MSANDSDSETFLTRWSRRKRRPEAEPETAPHSAPDAQTNAASARETDAFADFNFDSLNFTSDYRRFMASGVPDQVRSKALRKLWTSTDIIAQADELDDYLEDFREEAMALPAEMVRSAYRIGRGFVKSEQDAHETDQQLNAREHSNNPAEAAGTPAIADTRDKTADDGSGLPVTGSVDDGGVPAATNKLSS